VVDGTGAVVLSRKLVNDEQQIRGLVSGVDALGVEVSWTVDRGVRGPAVDGAGRCR